MKGKSLKDTSILSIKSINKNKVLDDSSNKKSDLSLKDSSKNSNIIDTSEKLLNNNKIPINISANNNIDLSTSSNSNSIIYNPSEMAKISNPLSSSNDDISNKIQTSKSKSKSKVKTKSKSKDQNFSYSKTSINNPTSQSSSGKSFIIDSKNSTLNRKRGNKSEIENINSSTALANQNILLSVDLDLNSSLPENQIASNNNVGLSKGNRTSSQPMVTSLFHQKNEDISNSKNGNTKSQVSFYEKIKEEKKENNSQINENSNNNSNDNNNDAINKVEDTTSPVNILSDSFSVPLFDSIITSSEDSNNLLLSSYVNANDLVINEANNVMSTSQEENSLLANSFENQNLNNVNSSLNDGVSPFFKKEMESDFTSLSPYQQLLIVEGKNDIPSTSRSLNTSAYGTLLKNNTSLPLSSVTSSSSRLVTKNSLSEHELVDYSGTIKGQNSDVIDYPNITKDIKTELDNPLMSSVQSYYQDKDSLMKYQSPYFEKTKIDPALLSQSSSSNLSNQSLMQSPMDVDSQLLNSKPSSLNYLSSNSLVNSSTSMDNARINTATVKIEPMDSTINVNELKNISSPSIASPGIASPGIASPGIASPNIASPNIASPNVASPAYYTVDSSGNQALVDPYSKTYVNASLDTINSDPSLLLIPDSTGSDRIASDPLLYQNALSADLLRKKLMVNQANKVSPSSSQMLPLLYQNQGVGNYLVRNKNVIYTDRPSLLNVNSYQANPLLVNQDIRKNLKRKMTFYHPYASLQRLNNLNSLSRKALLRKSALYNNPNLLNKNLYTYAGIPSNNVAMLYQNKLNSINSAAALHQNITPVNTLKGNYDLNTLNNSPSLPLWNQQIVDISNQDGSAIQEGLDLSHGVGYLSPVPTSSTSLNPLFESTGLKTLSNVEKTPQEINMKTPIDTTLDATELNSLVNINSYYIPTTSTTIETKGSEFNGLTQDETNILINDNKNITKLQENVIRVSPTNLSIDNNINSLGTVMSDNILTENCMNTMNANDNKRMIKETHEVVKEKRIDGLKSNKKIKEKGKEKSNISGESNILTSTTGSSEIAMIETSSNYSSPLLSQASYSDSTLALQKNDNSHSYLITPIHTPTLSEDTTISNNIKNLNPALSIPKITSISTPKRNLKTTTEVDTGIRTPISPPTMKNLYYIPNTTFTPKSVINSQQTVITTPVTTATVSANDNASTSETHPLFNNDGTLMESTDSPSVSMSNSVPSIVTTTHRSSKGTSYATTSVHLKSKAQTPNYLPSNNVLKKNITIKNNSVPRVALVPWVDRNTYVYQIEIGDKIVSRRFDNHFVNGTKLLNVAGLTRGKRDAILKNEPVRNVVKNAPFHLKGVWIPVERARILSCKFNIDDRIHYLLDNNPSKFLDNPNMWEINNWYLNYSKRLKKKFYPRH